MTENQRGALWMMASMAGFAFNDTFFKLAAADVPFYQAIFVRGVVASALLALVAVSTGALRVRVAWADWKRITLRTVAELIAVYCFLAALLHMPLANVTAVIQMLPLTIALAAAVFLAEPIGPRRAGAIAAGFIGVLLIIRPGTDGFSAYSLLGLAAVGAVTLRDLIVRRMSHGVPTALIAFVTSVAITVWAGGMMVLTQATWQPVDPGPMILLCAAASFVFAAYFCSVATMRHGDVAAVTPFRYSVMIWAVLLGWLAFGELPDALTGLGILVICLAGFYTLRRQ